MTNIKIDLHTHSIISHDGSINEQQYLSAVNKHLLDCIAITDHNEIAFAKKMNNIHGNKFIVGEEIDTGEGEVIGLFLSEKIYPKLGLKETITKIKSQKALVYIPHPLEKIRKGINRYHFQKYINLFDIVEIFNQKAFSRSLINEQYKFAVTAASSDAHCVQELGKTYSLVKYLPTPNNLTNILKNTEIVRGNINIFHRLCPLKNELKKLLF